MRQRFSQVCLAGATLLTVAGVADAHIVASRLGDFYAGALHPLTDLQDVVLWTALGLLAGSLGAAAGRWLVLLLPLGLVAGVVLGLSFNVGAVGLAGPVANAGMMVVLGLLLAAGVRIPAAAVGVMAFALALMRGVVNASGVGPETNRVLFAAGLAAAGYVTITLIMALTVAFRWSDAGAAASWRGIALRACGSWIAAIGLMVGGFALAI